MPIWHLMKGQTLCIDGREQIQTIPNFRRVDQNFENSRGEIEIITKFRSIICNLVELLSFMQGI